MKFKVKQSAILVTTAFTLCSCATGFDFFKNQDFLYRDTLKKVEEKHKETKKSEFDQSSLVKAKGSWIGGKAISLDKHPTLPDIFNQQWTFSFPGRLNISTIAERVSRITEVPVRIAPDVYMSHDQFILGGASASAAPSGAVDALGNVSGAQGPMPGGMSRFTEVAGSKDMAINYEGSLRGFLDSVCAKLNIDWEYKDGTIHLYRLITKSFTIKAAPGNSEFTASVGKTGITSGGTSDGGDTSSFSSDGNSRMASSYSIWPSIEAGIKTILSPVGKISVNQATGTIIVTDSKNIVNLVEKYINRENSIMTRQVRLRVEFLSVAISKEHESGIDWNAVYNKLDDSLALSLKGPAPLTNIQSGGFGFKINAGEPTNASLRFGGSEAMIKALAGFGKASIVTTTSAVTLNRQPVPVTLTEQVGYLAATTPATTSGGSGSGAPGLTPGLVTTGYVLNMLPTVMDTGSVLLQFAIDISELKRINTVTSGQGDSQQSIQTPEVTATQLLQRASIKTGETLVLAGFDREDGQYDKRSVTAKYSNATGTSTGRSKRTASVIMITPIIEDGE